MTKVKLVRAIIKLFFLGALSGSFVHIIDTAHKLGLAGWEAYATPFMIDGILVIAMVMRSEAFSARTRILGFRVMIAMGAVSMAANIYAAEVIGGYIFGVMVVTLYVAAEWLGGRLESVEVDHRRATEAKKAAATAKAKDTREANRKAKVNAQRAEKARATRERNIISEIIAQ